MRASGWDLDEDEAWFAGRLLSRVDAPLCLPLREQIRRLAARIRHQRFFARH